MLTHSPLPTTPPPFPPTPSHPHFSRRNKTNAHVISESFSPFGGKRTDYITSLPPEILSEIFTHCILIRPDNALLLSSVCRTFLHTARASPHTWRRLRLTLSYRPTYIVTQLQPQLYSARDALAAQKAAAWFARAGACTLEVAISVPGAAFPLLSSVLREHRDRIRSLVLREETEEKTFSFLGSIYAPFPAPALRCLSLTIANGGSADKDHLRTFTPLLSSVSVFYLDSLGPLHLATANLSNLRTLCITRHTSARSLPLGSIVDALLAAPALVLLVLEGRLYHHPTHTYASLVRMPSLTHLALRTNDNPALLGRLAVPALHTLHIGAPDLRYPERAEETALALRVLLNRMDTPLPARPDSHPHHHHPPAPNPRTPPGIQVLELVGFRTDRGSGGWIAALEACFCCMPGLRYLGLREMDPEPFLELLVRRMGSVPGQRDSPHPGLAAVSSGSRGSSASDWDRGGAVCPRLGCLVVRNPETSVALPAFCCARPWVRIGAAGK